MSDLEENQIEAARKVRERNLIGLKIEILSCQRWNLKTSKNGKRTTCFQKTEFNMPPKKYREDWAKKVQETEKNSRRDVKLERYANLSSKNRRYLNREGPNHSTISKIKKRTDCNEGSSSGARMETVQEIDLKKLEGLKRIREET